MEILKWFYHNWFTISVILYLVISLIVIISIVMIDGYGSDGVEVTIGSLLFPVYFLPAILGGVFALKISTIVKYFKRTKELCKCPLCGTGHKTFKDRFEKIAS